MIFDDIPTELKEHIFTYVPANEWINTAKVSKEWMDLTFRSIKRINSCHALILDYLAEFINEQRNTNYIWVSLLWFIPRLVHLEFDKFLAWKLSPLSHQFEGLVCDPLVVQSSRWNKPDSSFKNLLELRWDGISQGPAFIFKIFELAPKLEQLTLKNVKIYSEWKNKIPKSVKHVLLDSVEFCGCSIDNLWEDPTAVESFFAVLSSITVSAASQFFDKTPHLKNLALQFVNTKEATSMIVENALRKYPALELLNAFDVKITPIWRRLIPQNIKFVGFDKIDVQEDIRSEFSCNWLFRNYGCLQSLQVKRLSWTGLDPQKFYSTKRLKKLVLGNYSAIIVIGDNDAIDPFSDICFRMIRGSHLVDVDLFQPVIYESRRHIFPGTVKRLKLECFLLADETKDVFSPQFICENPSNIEVFSLKNYCSLELPAMSLNAFCGMNKLKKLQLLYSSISGECLQSIVTHCSALTDLTLRQLEYFSSGNIPANLVLSSLCQLHVQKPVDQPSLLLRHFPKLRAIDIAIFPPNGYFTDIMNALLVADTVELEVKALTWHILRSLVKSIDDTKFRYFCLPRKRRGFSFYFTNSLTNANCKLKNSFIFGAEDVLWTKNYPTSPLLRNNLPKVPSSMEELSKRYHMK